MSAARLLCRRSTSAIASIFDTPLSGFALCDFCAEVAASITIVCDSLRSDSAIGLVGEEAGAIEQVLRELRRDVRAQAESASGSVLIGE